MEMAEGKPPHHGMHPMRAFFLIPASPPPKLKYPDAFSPLFVDFLSKCLDKCPQKRMHAHELCAHEFIVEFKSDNAIRTMIERMHDYKTINSNSNSNSVSNSSKSNEKASNNNNPINQQNKGEREESDESAATTVATADTLLIQDDSTLKQQSSDAIKSLIEKRTWKIVRFKLSYIIISDCSF
jgi:serine/threonine protein kinase